MAWSPRSAGTLSLVSPPLRERGPGAGPLLQHFETSRGGWREVDVPPAPPCRDLGVLHAVDCRAGGDAPGADRRAGAPYLVEVMTPGAGGGQPGRTLDLHPHHLLSVWWVRDGMRIVDVRAIPLRGRVSEGGWEETLDPEENSHTLVQVLTDQGLSGVGSAYTSLALVEGALRLLRPWLIGELAIEPERVSEKLHQMSFWQGRGGAVTHAISGVDIAPWDILGKATGQPVARLLGAATATGSSPTAPSCSTSPAPYAPGWRPSWPAASGPSSWAGAPSGGSTGAPMSSSCAPPARRPARTWS